MRPPISTLLTFLFVLPLAAAAAPASVQVPASASPMSAKTAAGEVFLTVEEALELAFGEEAEVEKRTVYLTEEQRALVEGLLGDELPSGVARPYVATVEGEIVGVAWFDSHRVRTLRETLMFVVTPQVTVRRLEVLAFGEPREYLPPARWMAQFVGRGLDDELQLGRGIKRIAGATLSARATVDAARRSLALHSILFPAPEPEPVPEPTPTPVPDPAPSPPQGGSDL